MAESVGPTDYYDRMARDYETRAQEAAARGLPLYHWSRPEVLYTHFRRRERFVDALHAWGRRTIEGLDILDIGCGDGEFLRWLEEIGANSARLHGVEVQTAKAEEAKRKSPALDIRRVDGKALPFADHSLDLVVAHVVLSSIVEPSLREQLAREIERVLRPAGAFFLFDMRWVAPGAQHVVPIPNAEVDRLFPWARRTTWPLLLAPPIARRVTPRSSFLAIVLERLLPWLNTHRFHLLRR